MFRVPRCFNEQQREKTCLLTRAPNDDSDQSGHPISLHRPHEETMRPLLSKNAPSEKVADLNLRWTYMAEGTFSIVAVQIFLHACYVISRKFVMCHLK